MNAIAPIQTTYHGYRFRSRLEARWATFFDALGLRWDYEPEGYDVNGIPYLPDFWLPDWRLWIEIKGPIPTPEEFQLCSDLRTNLDQPVAIFHGLPAQHFGALFCGDTTDSSGGNGTFWGIIGERDGKIGMVVIDDREDRTFFSGGGFSYELPWILAGDFEGHSPRIQIAADAARSARFEHRRVSA